MKHYNIILYPSLGLYGWFLGYCSFEFRWRIDAGSHGFTLTRTIAIQGFDDEIDNVSSFIDDNLARHPECSTYSSRL